MALGAAVSALFAAGAHQTKATGQRMEAAGYRRSSQYALDNVRYTEESTAIKEMQQQRQAYKVIGGEESDIAAGGGAASGSALDVLRDSASQSALTHAVIHRQGLITEEGYKQQSLSYNSLATAADMAAAAEEKAATGAKWAAAFEFLSTSSAGANPSAGGVEGTQGQNGLATDMANNGTGIYTGPASVPGFA